MSLNQQSKDIQNTIAATDAAKYNLEQTQEARIKSALNKDLAKEISDTAKSGDIKLAIYSEMSLDSARINSPGISPQEANSNRATVKQGLAALQAYDNMKADPDAYKRMAASLSDKDIDKESLPKDACRNFIQSHIKRLDNRLTASMPQDEREVLEARKGAMRSIRQEYIREQKEALGIPHDKKASLENIEKGNALRTMPLDDVVKKYPDLKNEVDVLKMAEQQASAIPDKDVRAQSIEKFRSFVAERFDNNEKFEQSMQQTKDSPTQQQDSKPKSKDNDIEM